MMKDKIVERLPLNGTFELTARCNLSCKMCLVRIDQKRMKELGGIERTADEWIHMAQEVQEAGTISLLLTGGEPMLRPDFVRIYRSIAQMGFILTLYTNATLVTPEIMEVLREYPPHEIGLTIYGASPETYEKVTGNANAYYRMLEGVEQLRRLPSKIALRTTLIQDNVDDLDHMVDWAKHLELDKNFTVSKVITKAVRGGIADVEACRLTPEQNVVMLEKRCRELMIKPLIQLVNDNPVLFSEDRKGIYASSKIDQYFKQEIREHQGKELMLYGCSAGIYSYTISWDGKLIGCQLLGDCWTYPFDNSFNEAWNGFPECVKVQPIPEPCESCKLKCSACPATRLAETGFLDGLPEYLCRESRLTSEMNKRLIKEFKSAIAERMII